MFRELIRQNKKLTDAQCTEVLKTEKRGVLSVMGDDEYPYGMPMNHWYNEDDGYLYFHSGNVGYRLEMLKKHDKVSYCVFDKGYLVEGDWAYRVKSVILFGKVEFIEDKDTVIDIVTRLSRTFTDDESFITKHIENNLDRTVMFRIKIQHMTGKLVTES